MTPEELEAIKEILCMSDKLEKRHLLPISRKLLDEVERAWAENLELRSEIKTLHDVLAPADLLVGELSAEIEEKDSYIADLEEQIEICDCDDYKNGITDGFQRDFINNAFEKDEDDA